jgi:DNA mismatch repair protein MutS2
LSIPKKTLEDLEFNIVVENVSKYAVTNIGRDLLNSLKPDLDFKKIDFNLNLVSEYLSSLENDNNFPNHGFESISKELKIIEIENSQLEIESFRKIKHLVESSILHIKFLKKFKNYYKNIFLLTDSLKMEKNIIIEISSVIDKYGFIKDNASLELLEIRKVLTQQNLKLDKPFQLL